MFVSTIFIAVCLTAGTAGAADYFVSMTGVDGAAGSILAPWRTIQYAADQVVAGDTVHVRGGVYTGRVDIGSSGNASAGYITFHPYSNEHAVIDATGVAKIGNELSVVRIETQNYVRVAGFEIRNATITGTQETGEGSGIRVFGSGHHIEILSNTIHDIRGPNAMGITVYGSSLAPYADAPVSNLLIADNLVYDCEPAKSEALTLNGWVVDFRVLRNEVRDVNNIGIDVIGGEDWLGSALPGNGLIAWNTVKNANSAYEGGYGAGIYSDGASDLVIEGNVVTGSDMGIEVGAENAGIVSRNVTVRNNLLYENYKAGLVFGGYDKNEPTGYVTGCAFVNNTLYRNNRPDDTGPYFDGAENGEIWIQWAETNLVANNAVYARAGVSYMRMCWDAGFESGNVFSNNVYFTPDGSNSAVFVVNGVEYSTFGDYAGSGAEDTARFVSPLFADATNADFHLTAGSPCIDTGAGMGDRVTNDLKGVSRPLDGDFDGTNKIDVGCREYVNSNSDSDGDTMRDAWEVDHGLDPLDVLDAAGNLDGDPFDNAEEHTCDTDPRDPLSHFRVRDLSNSPPVRVYFDSSSNRVYSLRRRASLSTGDWSWVEAQTNRPGTGSPTWLTDTNPPGPLGAYGVSVGL